MTKYFELNEKHTDPSRMKKERDKARELKKTQWWKTKLAQGVCEYCHQHFKASELTMDHVMPLARGGTSVRSNIVASCKLCNENKKLSAPIDDAFAALEAEKKIK